jgi:hypothetical protein
MSRLRRSSAIFFKRVQFFPFASNIPSSFGLRLYFTALPVFYCKPKKKIDHDTSDCERPLMCRPFSFAFSGSHPFLFPFFVPWSVKVSPWSTPCPLASFDPWAMGHVFRGHININALCFLGPHMHLPCFFLLLFFPPFIHYTFSRYPLVVRSGLSLNFLRSALHQLLIFHLRCVV